MWWLLGALGLLCIGWGLVSARRVLRPLRYSIPPPHPLPAFTTHMVTAADGVHFDVWLLESDAPARGRLLVCHGYYANRYQVLDIAEHLRRRGYEVLLFDMRGHGTRPPPCTLGSREADDARAALDWAEARPGAARVPAGVLGLSMGGSVACLLASRDARIRAVAVDSVYSRLFPVLKRTLWQRYRVPSWPFAWITWWAVQLWLRMRLGPVDPAVIAAQLRQPLLAIQGGEDRRVVPLLGREFFRAWGGPKERWFEEHVAHIGMFARHPKQYGDRVADFFNRALGGIIVR